MSHLSKPTHPRALDTVLLTLFGAASLTASGCIGVRDQLFQPLPQHFGTDAIVNFEKPNGIQEPNDEARREGDVAPLPPPDDKRLKMEPHEDADELLLELQDIEPTPKPLGGRGGGAESTVSSGVDSDELTFRLIR